MEMERKDCSHKVDKLIERHAWISSEKHLCGRGGTDYDFVSRDPSKWAAKNFPVVKNQHLLFCTLLIDNSLAMESLPIFLDKLVPSWAAILLSVTLILMIGEVVFFEVIEQILPQAICTRYGLTVGATVAPFVQLLLWLFFPVAYPISKILNWMLGKGHVALLRRAELKTFVDFHGNEAGKGGDLTHDETTIIARALELTEKTAKDAMTPISKPFSIDLDGTLSLETLNAIKKSYKYHRDYSGVDSKCCHPVGGLVNSPSVWVIVDTCLYARQALPLAMFYNQTKMTNQYCTLL